MRLPGNLHPPRKEGARMDPKGTAGLEHPHVLTPASDRGIQWPMLHGLTACPSSPPLIKPLRLILGSKIKPERFLWYIAQSYTGAGGLTGSSALLLYPTFTVYKASRFVFTLHGTSTCFFLYGEWLRSILKKITKVIQRKIIWKKVWLFCLLACLVLLKPAEMHSKMFLLIHRSHTLNGNHLLIPQKDLYHLQWQGIHPLVLSSIILPGHYQLTGYISV